MYKPGEIIFKEGDKIEKPFMVISGKVLLTSTLGYTLEVPKGEIIGEWTLLESSETPESATAAENVELSPVEDMEFSYHLLSRAFQRLEMVDKAFTAELRPIDEVMRIIKQVTKGGWKFFSEVRTSPYYTARHLISMGKFEEAYKELVAFDKRSSPPILADEVEIWKAYCLYFLDPKSAAIRYNALIRKAQEYRKLISFALLMEVFSKGPENINTTLSLYLKHGVLIPPKTIVMVEGETGLDALFVLSGYPRIARFSSGKEKILSFLGPAEVIGEVSTLGDRPRTATVLATSVVQGLLFSKSAIEGIVNTNQDFGMQILKSELKRIQRMKMLKEIGRTVMGKFKVLLLSWDLKDLNAMEITLEEMEKYLGLSRQETLDFLNSTKVVSLRSDGTLKFISKLSKGL